jgi:hypothetical protein
MPSKAARVNQWSPQNNTLTLQLSHEDGAIEVEIDMKDHPEND